MGLWHDVARCLAYRLMVMSARDRELVGVDSCRFGALLTEAGLSTGLPGSVSC